MPRFLELFSGTKSVGKVAEELGFGVVSLDLRNADINSIFYIGITLFSLPELLMLYGPAHHVLNTVELRQWDIEI